MSRNEKCIATSATDSTGTGRLPPALLCHRTGLAAGTSDGCGARDACLWVRAQEKDFADREGEPDE